MLQVISKFFDEHGDPRIKDYFLMSSPWPICLILIFYVFFVKYLGPKLMENRRPFKFDKILVVYNLIQVAINARTFYNSLFVLGWATTVNWRCEPFDGSTTDLGIRKMNVAYHYFLSKIVDLLDTVFFVLRKKDRQITALHVIHHTIMPLFIWMAVKLMPGGHGSFTGFLNSAVHVVMYSYYMLAAMGPGVQKYLWWKKYITQMQLLQFVAVSIHSMQLYFHNPCNYPLGFSHVIVLSSVYFFVEFSYFYIQAYKNQRKVEEQKKIE